MVKSTIIRKKESHRFGSKQNMKSFLFTPIRKLLRIKIRQPAAEPFLGKRPREEYEYSDPVDPIVETPPITPSPTPFTSSPTHASHITRTGSAPATPLRVALQNIDPDEGTDTVIITTLDNIPFCCHEDLLTMSRSQLIHVATQLNDKLPLAMRIQVGNTKSGVEVRKEIEGVVGLRERTNGIPQLPTPGAPPKVDQRVGASLTPTASLDEEEEEEESLYFSPPTSPLARRSRINPSEAMLTTKLARLVEEEEEEEEEGEDSPMVIENRPSKRRRVFSEDSPTPAPRAVRARSYGAKRDSPMPKSVLGRSGMDMRFVTTTRPTYRSLRWREHVVIGSPDRQSSPFGVNRSSVVSMDID